MDQSTPRDESCRLRERLARWQGGQIAQPAVVSNSESHSESLESVEGSARVVHQHQHHHHHHHHYHQPQPPLNQTQRQSPLASPPSYEEATSAQHRHYGLVPERSACGERIRRGESQQSQPPSYTLVPPLVPAFVGDESLAGLTDLLERLPSSSRAPSRSSSVPSLVSVSELSDDGYADGGEPSIADGLRTARQAARRTFLRFVWRLIEQRSRLTSEEAWEQLVDQLVDERVFRREAQVVTAYQFAFNRSAASHFRTLYPNSLSTITEWMYDDSDAE